VAAIILQMFIRRKKWKIYTSCCTYSIYSLGYMLNLVKSALNSTQV